MNDSTRRTFLKTAAAVTAASQARILGANDRIRVAGIGTGGRGQYLLGIVSKTPGAEIVALCDVYEPHRAQARKRCAPDAREVLDFREILDDKTIDAVVVATPNHWHVPITVAAVGAGKDVYCEKPVTHTIEEGDVLQRAVDQSGRIVQVGMQQRSWPHFAAAKALIEAGELGQLTYIRTYWYQNHLQGGNGPFNSDPTKLDWKRWLGSAPERPFEAIRFEHWRWFWDYGEGALTDLFSHWIDVVHWYIGSDTPDLAAALGGKWALPLRECPDTVSASFDYPGKLTVSYDGSLIGYREGGGLILHGTKAVMRLYRGGYGVYAEMPHYSESPELEMPVKSAKTGRDGSEYHVENFLDCVRSRHVPNAPVAAGIAAARAGHLGNIAMRQKRVVAYPG
jgi:predicted dehydrogenase